MEQTVLQAPRGTYDILPQEVRQWRALETILQDIVEKAGYQEIRIPVFEHTELFKRGVGETTDIVNKEMYTFLDKSERSITLRPEATAGLVRSYLENGLHRQPLPVKLSFIGPMFRYERTQTGRQRQFHQLDIEAFGSEGPAIDAEVITVAVDCVQRTGASEFEVQVNSIGCKICRPAHRDILREAVRPKLAYLCEDCRNRCERNPLRMLDCKNESCKVHYLNLPSSLDSLCEKCRLHWDELLKLLSHLGVETKVNQHLVRGLDYYSRTVFEIVSNDPRLGAQSTICGGGRYDYLVEAFGGPPTPAVGWALGLERMRLLLSEIQGESSLIFIAAADMQAALSLARDIRQAGFHTELDFPPYGIAGRSLSRQLQQANKLGAQWTVIAGSEELAAAEITVKNMHEGTQSRISRDKLIEFLRN